MTDNNPYAARLSALRAEIKKQKLDGFIVPRADEYQGEYVPDCAMRLAWISGFTGSAGAAVILQDKAVVLSDGRYTLQLEQQVDRTLFETANITKHSIGDWLAGNAARGQVIGYDPWLLTPAQLDKLEEKIRASGLKLKAAADNPLDKVWTDRPGLPLSAAHIFPEETAGKNAADKRQAIAGEIQKQNAFAALVSMPDSIAWLLNIRGGDIPYIPVALSYAAVYADGRVDWFIDPDKAGPEVRAHIGNAVRVLPPSDLPGELAQLARAAKKAGQPVWLDGKRSAVWFKMQIENSGADILDLKDPCILPKARKTPAEQKAMEAAHIRDGAAVVRFLKWLSEAGPGGTETELSAEEKLESFRAMAPEYREPSFETIAGYGANGAIVHYRATEESNLVLQPGGLLLVDSGAQYDDGTTDITRTVAIGTPAQEMKERFTLVLKGHIALARARFPAGTTGAQLDTLARKALWEAGLDYAHGTGHGVGCYLSVHEEAASISPRGVDALEPGMILSNEPGYYKNGEYGIRIENLVLVEKDDGPPDVPMLRFKTITLAPIDPALIVPDMLDAAERDWLKTYHARVFEILSPVLAAEEAAWLKDSCFT